MFTYIKSFVVLAVIAMFFVVNFAVDGHRATDPFFISLAGYVFVGVIAAAVLKLVRDTDWFLPAVLTVAGAFVVTPIAYLVFF